MNKEEIKKDTDIKVDVLNELNNENKNSSSFPSRTSIFLHSPKEIYGFGRDEKKSEKQLDRSL